MPFKDRRESVEDEQRAGRPSASRTEKNVARVEAFLDIDRRLNVRLIAEEVGLPKTDVHRIMTEDLHMRKFVRNWSRRICPMCGNFWLKIISQRFPTHRTALTWLRAILFIS